MSVVPMPAREQDHPAVFEYDGDLYPDYLRRGNAMQHIAATALHFCKGEGLDVGAGRWPLPGTKPLDRISGHDAMDLPAGQWDFVFSSHLLEHLVSPVAAVEHWLTRIRPGGVLFLYLPHPDQKYWRPSRCRKHLHILWPKDTAAMLRDLGLVNVLHSERDLAWSFSVVGWKP